MSRTKVCIVTGGALGIGRALTKSFAQSGYRVYFVDKNAEAGNQLTESLTAEGRDVRFYALRGGCNFQKICLPLLLPVSKWQINCCRSRFCIFTHYNTFPLTDKNAQNGNSEIWNPL